MQPKLPQDYKQQRIFINNVNSITGNSYIFTILNLFKAKH